MAIKTIIVHEFFLGDVDDPDLFAASPLYEWNQSIKGKWVHENAVEPPVCHQTIDYARYGYRYTITAKFHEINITEYYLRWG